MSRVRTDNVFGTTTNNPLTNVGTTLNSDGLANLAAVSSAEAIIILDPNRVSGAPEIVVVTAHTASATSATIVRGQFGTTARQHDSGTEWVHGPIASNASSYATASDDQGDFVPMNEWGTWTPTFTNFTQGDATVTARFVRIGRTIHYRLAVTLGGTSAMGSNPTFTLPVAAVSMGSTEPMGIASLRDEGTADYAATVRVGSTTTATLFSLGASSVHTTITSTAPFTWVSTDKFYAQGAYEAAT